MWQQESLSAFLGTLAVYNKSHIQKFCMLIQALHLIIMSLTSIGEVKCTEFNQRERNTC